MNLVGNDSNDAAGIGDAVALHTQIAQEFDRKYRESPDFRERFQTWTQVLDRYVRHEGQCLDLGCGSGVFSFYMAEKSMQVAGVDGSQAMLDICLHKKSVNPANVRFFCCDIQALPGELHRQYDVVICSSVLEYVADMAGVLTMIRSLLAPDGVLVFSLPNGESLYRKFERLLFRMTGKPSYYRHVKNVRTLDAVKQELAQAGLIVVESWYFGRLPVLTTLLRSMLGRARSDSLLGLVVRRN